MRRREAKRGEEKRSSSQECSVADAGGEQPNVVPRLPNLAAFSRLEAAIRSDVAILV